MKYSIVCVVWYALITVMFLLTQVLGQVDIHRECEEESRLVKSFFIRNVHFNYIGDVKACCHKGFILQFLLTKNSFYLVIVAVIRKYGHTLF